MSGTSYMVFLWYNFTACFLIRKRSPLVCQQYSLCFKSEQKLNSEKGEVREATKVELNAMKTKQNYFTTALSNRYLK